MDENIVSLRAVRKPNSFDKQGQITCVCGAKVLVRNFDKHLVSQKHMIGKLQL